MLTIHFDLCGADLVQFAKKKKNELTQTRHSHPYKTHTESGAGIKNTHLPFVARVRETIIRYLRSFTFSKAGK